MAFITSIEAGQASSGSRSHTTCSATWRMNEHNGAPVFQIDTYGSSERKDQGTVSQSMQLDATRAAELIKLLRGAFPQLH